MPKIEVPEHLSANNFRDFAHEFEKLIAETRERTLEIDFERCRFVETCGAIYMRARIDQIGRIGWQVYAKNLGSKLGNFFESIGFIRPAAPDAQLVARGQKSVRIRKCVNADSAFQLSREIVPHIKSMIQCSDEVLKVIDWSLWELMDNAGNHGYKWYEKRDANYPEPIYVCAHEYKAGWVEVSILDLGQGIYNSLRVKHPDVSQRNSLERAMVKGVSGHPGGSPGFGLFGVSELAKKGGGEFFLWSSGHCLKQVDGKRMIFGYVPQFGTLVTFRFFKNAAIKLEEILKTRTSAVSTAEYFENLGIVIE